MTRCRALALFAAALGIALLARGSSHAVDCCNIEFARQSDGGIIDVGVLSTGGAGYAAVSKRTPEGPLDPSFGVDGVTAPIDGLPGGFRVLTVLPDDKIVVAGQTGTSSVRSWSSCGTMRMGIGSAP